MTLDELRDAAQGEGGMTLVYYAAVPPSERPRLFGRYGPVGELLCSVDDRERRKKGNPRPWRVTARYDKADVRQWLGDNQQRISEAGS